MVDEVGRSLDWRNKRELSRSCKIKAMLSEAVVRMATRKKHQGGKHLSVEGGGWRVELNKDEVRRMKEEVGSCSRPEGACRRHAHDLNL